ncbi:MAG: hypothetical protein AAB448_04555 [Patescibacteria group bacterium]
MNDFAERKYVASPETHEQLRSYEFQFTLYRHGPKTSVNGDLSEAGWQKTKDFHAERYDKGLADVEKVDLIVSPIFRTWGTGQAATAALVERMGEEGLGEVGVDERLTEGVLSENEDRVNEIGRLTGGPDGRHGRMLVGWLGLEKPLDNWPEMMTYKQAAGNIAELILERVLLRKEAGGNQKLEAFSHGPVLAAFIVRLEELSGQKLLPQDWKEQAVSGDQVPGISDEDKKKTSPMWTLFDFNSHAILRADSYAPEEFTVEFHGKTIRLSLDVLREMAGQETLEEKHQWAAK